MTRNEIVVGLDDSLSARSALAWAAAQARRTGRIVRAVHVLSWPVGYGAVGFAGAIESTYLPDPKTQEAYRSTIARVFEEVHPPADWLVQFAEGDAGVVLVNQAQGAELLVIGTREHVGLARLLSGSVSHYCLSHATCPIVAVPALPVPATVPATVPSAAPRVQEALA